MSHKSNDYHVWEVVQVHVNDLSDLLKKLEELIRFPADVYIITAHCPLAELKGVQVLLRILDYSKNELVMCDNGLQGHLRRYIQSVNLH